MITLKQFISTNPFRGHPTAEQHLQHVLDEAAGKPSEFEKLLLLRAANEKLQ